MQMSTRRIVQIASGDYRWPEWSPDGQRMVVTGPAELERHGVLTIRPKLYLLDVSDIVINASDTIP
jgi:hypothetical protein